MNRRTFFAGIAGLLGLPVAAKAAPVPTPLELFNKAAGRDTQIVPWLWRAPSYGSDFNGGKVCAVTYELGEWNRKKLYRLKIRTTEHADHKDREWITIWNTDIE